MRVAIVGSGYVGLVSGVCLAAQGHTVTSLDHDTRIVEGLNAGTPHIHERDLEALLGAVRTTGAFRATDSMDEALAGADIAIVAVGTPSVNGRIELGQVLGAVRNIGRRLPSRGRFLPVIVKSTVVPGSTDGPVRAELEAASKLRLGQFGLGMNPEFLREGEAVGDFMFPDRIVLGHADPGTLAALDELYAPWDCDKLRVNTRTAELIKYANNALLATQISAVNEIANLAAAIGGIDVLDVMEGVKLDRRWNPAVDGRRVNPGILAYLVPGCGFGGSCFPKDVEALRACGHDLGLSMDILDAVLAVNAVQPDRVAAAVGAQMGDLTGRRVLVLGLAFKVGTDDVREAVSLKIVKGFLRGGARVMAHDPIAVPNFQRALGAAGSAVHYVREWQSHIADVDAVVITTAWPEYRGLAGADLRGKIVFDGRRMFEPNTLPGADYMSIGRAGA